MVNDLTIVTGYWNVRRDRLDSRYLENFKNVLRLSKNMVIFIPKIYEEFVIKNRNSYLDNTEIIIVELDDIKNCYFNKYWDLVQSIRTNNDWINIAYWLKKVPQCFSEWYNPIVMSKVFFLKDAYDKKLFNTDKFIWIDAGITQHIKSNLITNEIIQNSINYIDKVFFTSIDYNSSEMHGFLLDGYKKYVNFIPNWLCRATIFGCDAKYINKFTEDYSYYLYDTLDRGYMGTEESIFTLLSCVNGDIYHRFHMGNESMPDVFFKHIKAQLE